MSSDCSFLVLSFNYCRVAAVRVAAAEFTVARVRAARVVAAEVTVAEVRAARVTAAGAHGS